MKRLFVPLLLFVLSVLNSFGQENDDSRYTADLLKIGEIAPDFVIANGDTLTGKSLSSFRGSFVVLDFWASWCRDCRRDIPVVKELYNRFAPYGVKFIGVSFDSNREAWDKCIKDNDMNWIHHSELKPWKQTGISEDYHIKWIPTMYLVDKEGKVMFATIHANEMETVLSLIMANHFAEERYPGGLNALSKYIRNKLQYPDLAKEFQAEGEVTIFFVVNPDGSVSDITAKDCKVTYYNELQLNKYPIEKQQTLRKELARMFAKEGYRVIKGMKSWKQDKTAIPFLFCHKITFSFM